MAFINDNQIWDFQVEDCYFLDNADFSRSTSQSIQSSWSENISYTWGGEITPVKDVIEHAYIAENIENKNKRRKQCEAWSQAKRHCLRQVDSEVVDGLCDELNSSSNEMGDSVNEVLSQMSYWLCEEADDMSSLLSLEVLDKSFEGWLSSCLTDHMEFNHYKVDTSGPSDDQNNATGTRNLSLGLESTTTERPFLRCHNSDFKGKKSLMQISDTTSPAFVVYPFTFLKPCGFRGDVTLNDINLKIHGPPKSQEYSTFSGKPVVAKTKLCTGGGKGSMTIMRTIG